VTLESALPSDSAAAAGLRYVNDVQQPGIGRRRAGSGFSYRMPDGRRLTDRETMKRIRQLVIPPAWTDVWVCPDPLGHIQATGRDSHGRKQYLYHPLWHQVRDQGKYERLIAFAKALPRIRKRLNHDLRRHGMPREKILATVVKLLEETSIRIGNEEYRRQHRSFGLTTLRNRHARFESKSTIRFEFTGKSGKQHMVRLTDLRLARIVRQLQELPGQELFQYVDEDGQRHSIDSSDVNAYLRDISGDDEFTAKDFRTWNGTVLALRYLRLCEAPQSPTAAKREVSTAIKSVAHDLGNTPAVCRSAYIHPRVLDAFTEGSLPDGEAVPNHPSVGLSDEEKSVLRLLKASLPRNGQPPAREQVVKRASHQDRQPHQGGDADQPGHRGAPAQVHEIHRHDEYLHGGDQQTDDGVEAAQVDKRQDDIDGGHDQQDQGDDDVARRAGNALVHG
jgi:DNA topoisomerase-1